MQSLEIGIYFDILTAPGHDIFLTTLKEQQWILSMNNFGHKSKAPTDGPGSVVAPARGEVPPVDLTGGLRYSGGDIIPNIRDFVLYGFTLSSGLLVLMSLVAQLVVALPSENAKD